MLLFWQMAKGPKDQFRGKFAVTLALAAMTASLLWVGAWLRRLAAKGNSGFIPAKRQFSIGVLMVVATVSATLLAFITQIDMKVFEVISSEIAFFDDRCLCDYLYYPSVNDYVLVHIKKD